ncbi:hypothetical protein PtB15_12B305 [Puccinia triticina]|nr:hypothetical protein PtB15_12B305 [Puccinia triticina]
MVLNRNPDLDMTKQISSVPPLRNNHSTRWEQVAPRPYLVQDTITMKQHHSPVPLVSASLRPFCSATAPSARPRGFSLSPTFPFDALKMTHRLSS